MSDTELGKHIAEALFVKEFEKEMFKAAIAEVFSKVLS